MLDELENRLQAARSGDRALGLKELEELYTSGCAQVLELEADATRIGRRVHELRDQLRHLRTAIAFLQEQQANGDS